jgi:hypothetical protein
VNKHRSVFYLLESFLLHTFLEFSCQLSLTLSFTNVEDLTQFSLPNLFFLLLKRHSSMLVSLWVDKFIYPYN